MVSSHNYPHLLSVSRQARQVLMTLTDARIIWSTPVAERDFHKAMTCMKRKLALEVFREYLESAENMLPSKVLGEVVSDEDQEGVVLGMLEEVYDMIHELDRQRLQHERFLRIQRNVRTNQVDVADVRQLDAKRLRQE